MDPNIINKILCNSFPEEIIREITSYFILKIPKTDKRITYLDLLVRERNSRIIEDFHNDGLSNTFVGLKIYISFCIWPKDFILYIFGNRKTKEQTYSRFWFQDGKHEERINGSWVVKTL
jgi:hypothetical protein